MEGRLLVRAAEPRDDAAIARLRWLSDAQHAESLPDYFRVPEHGARPVPRSGPGQQVLVAEVEGGVRGYLVLHLVSTPPEPSTMPGLRARVDAVVVDPAARRQGLGRRLMAEALRLADEFGAKDLVLTVWRGNAEAEAFYAGLGFSPLATVLRQGLKKS